MTVAAAASFGQVDNLHSVFGDDLGDKGGLIDNESGTQLGDASSASCNSLLESHALLVVVVENTVHEVASIAVGTLCYLLKCSKIVHPIQLCLAVESIEASDQAVDLERSLAKSLSHL